MLVSNSTNTSDVCDAHPGVGRALQVDKAGSWGDSLCHGIQVRCVNERDLNPAVCAILCQEPVHTTINILIRDDLVSVLQQSHDRVQGRHARCESKGSCCLLQHRNMFLQGSPRRISRSGVVVRPKLAGRRLHESGCLVNRCVGGMIRVLRASVKDHALRSRLQLVLEACEIWSDGKCRQVVVVALPLRQVETHIREVQLLANGALRSSAHQHVHVLIFIHLLLETTEV
mmetsp:Transcript_10485/g.25237  ORF Transcript_10485/g.25237 Transcript_10485/m.25237 type:complete len:229 (-) Transcript_10485:233-919(-)